MSLYSVALFVHIVGAMLLFVLLTLEGVALRAGVPAGPAQRVLGPIALVAILVPGFYMVATSAGWTGWASVGLAAYVVIAGLGAYTGVNVMRGRMSSRSAMVSWLARAGIALAIVFDMTVKPGLIVAAMIAVAGLAAGAAIGLAWRRDVRTA